VQSKVTATGMIISEPPNHEEKLLIVEIAIDCPACGKTTLRIPGHHLKAVRQIAQSYCDQFPELTGGSVEVLHSYDFTTAASERPENN